MLPLVVLSGIAEPHVRSPWTNSLGSCWDASSGDVTLVDGYSVRDKHRLSALGTSTSPISHPYWRHNQVHIHLMALSAKGHPNCSIQTAPWPPSQSQRSRVGDWDRREEGPGPGQEAKGADLADAVRAAAGLRGHPPSPAGGSLAPTRRAVTPGTVNRPVLPGVFESPHLANAKNNVCFWGSWATDTWAPLCESCMFQETWGLDDWALGEW